MQLDMMTARRRERRDGIPCFTIHEPAPSNVAHLFHPNHPDYEAARRVHEAKVAEREKHMGVLA